MSSHNQIGVATFCFTNIVPSREKMIKTLEMARMADSLL
jgi:hypothetical protein